MSNQPFKLIYIGRSRLQRNRANLLQTLHMVRAFDAIGVATRLYLPPWPSDLVLQERLDDFGIDSALDVHPSQLLHSRWKNRPFVWFHQRMLRRADALYVRSVPISLLLSTRELPHHLEIHDTASVRQDQLKAIVQSHRQGLIRWLVPISEAAASDLIAAGADKNRILVAPSGVDLNAFATIAPFRPQTEGLPRIVYPGTLSRDRGLGIFEALAQNEMAEITLLGDQEDTPKSLSRLKVVNFVPHREVPNWYGRCDVVLLPYQKNLRHAASISPIKLFEAMAAGRPIIASDLPTIREILEHEKTALLVEPTDTGGWIAAVRRMQCEPDLASRLAQAAKAKAVEFSWEKRAERIARTCGWLS
jgi:glycosyltransferase involved in cell wall biosynthesis